MQTQNVPILNLSNLSANPSSAPKQNSNATIETPFNQVLSREIADRHSPAPVHKAKPSEKLPEKVTERSNSEAAPTPATTSAGSEPNTADGGVKNPSDDRADDAADPTTATAADVTTAAAATTDASTTTAATDVAASVAAATTPTSELLALVASFNQPSTTPIAASTLATRTDRPSLNPAIEQAANGKIALTDVLATRTEKSALSAAIEPVTGKTDPAPTAAFTPALSAQAASDILPGTAKTVFAGVLDQTGKAAATSIAGNDQPTTLATSAAPIDDNPTGIKLLGQLTAKATDALQSVTSGVAKADGTNDKAAVGKLQAVTGTGPTTATAAATVAAPVGAVSAREAVIESPVAAKTLDTNAITGTGAVAAPVAPASLAISQAALGRPIDKLSPQVGTPAWDQAVGQKVIWLSAGGLQSATLTLNPPDLGPLQVVLSVSNDQTNVAFTAAQPEVRQALESALPKLREILSEAGIQLGNTSVGSGQAGNQSASSGDQQQSGRASRFESARAQPEAPVPTTRIKISNSESGLVDIFA
jgi:flagellar hook-length control protein FliK